MPGIWQALSVTITSIIIVAAIIIRFYLLAHLSSHQNHITQFSRPNMDSRVWDGLPYSHRLQLPRAPTPSKCLLWAYSHCSPPPSPSDFPLYPIVPFMAVPDENFNSWCRWMWQWTPVLIRWLHGRATERRQAQELHASPQASHPNRS